MSEIDFKGGEVAGMLAVAQNIVDSLLDDKEWGVAPDVHKGLEKVKKILDKIMEGEDEKRS